MSCSLFTFYVDCIIQAISQCGEDGWLGTLHCLMQMDDTAVLATSRDRLINKLRKLKYCSDDIDQTMHPVKSKYLVVNSADREAITLDNIVISHMDSYVYLGTPMSNSPLGHQVQDHLHRKNAHVIKFLSFLSRNRDVPYHVKEKVWCSALTSAILYSCESWLCSDLRSAETPYMSTLKQMLGVRSTTCNDITLLEAGVPSARTYIARRQVSFLHKLHARPDFPSSYLNWLIDHSTTPILSLSQS